MILVAAALAGSVTVRAQRAMGGSDACPAQWSTHSKFDLERSHDLIAQARALHAMLAATLDDGRRSAADRDETEAKIVSFLCRALLHVPRRGRLRVLGEAYRRAGDTHKAALLLNNAQALEGGSNRELPALPSAFAAGGSREEERKRGRVNGVIVFLVSPREGDVADLSRSLELLDANFFQAFGRCYDVVIFHDGLSQPQQRRIRAATRCPLRLPAIDLRDLPPTAARHAEQALRAAQQSRAGPMDSLQGGPGPHATAAGARGGGGGGVGYSGGEGMLSGGQNGEASGVGKFAEREALGGLGGYRFMCRFFAGAVFELGTVCAVPYD